MVLGALEGDCVTPHFFLLIGRTQPTRPLRSLEPRWAEYLQGSQRGYKFPPVASHHNLAAGLARPIIGEIDGEEKGEAITSKLIGVPMCGVLIF